MAERTRRASMEILREAAPEVAECFSAMRAAIDDGGSLDTKTRALIVCGSFAATHNEVGFRSHYRRALAAGVTPDEVRQAVLLALGFTQGIANVASTLAWMEEQGAAGRNEPRSVPVVEI